ncbi:DUF6764 family protein [Rhodococcus sp. AG1013]|uniref:DUF6764 family protein n=1 Tax=unclassified Rhodococcus (in: high G+C Gram-positive bacteria) TaxID=192944 RepID=UPI000E0C380A|nr:DUF6764 family protein [Rhodococcus sp. AG1013]RDI33678.1 hypothetical protein DEU38_10233 [Rhodococcus sp. AG1013]
MSTVSRLRAISDLGRRMTRAAVIAAAGIGVAVGVSMIGTGTAAAAPVACLSPGTPNDIQVSDYASCGAQAFEQGVARSAAMDSGTAVSVAQDLGSSNSLATGFGTALSASRGNGQSLALAIGGGIAHSWADDGYATFAVAGWGSGATAEQGGVNCVGPLSFAWNLKTGQTCLG